jgi:hypothetical protein
MSSITGEDSEGPNASSSSSYPPHLLSGRSLGTSPVDANAEDSDSEYEDQLIFLEFPGNATSVGGKMTRSLLNMAIAKGGGIQLMGDSCDVSDSQPANSYEQHVSDTENIQGSVRDKGKKRMRSEKSGTDPNANASSSSGNSSKNSLGPMAHCQIRSLQLDLLGQLQINVGSQAFFTLHKVVNSAPAPASAPMPAPVPASLSMPADMPLPTYPGQVGLHDFASAEANGSVPIPTPASVSDSASASAPVSAHFAGITLLKAVYRLNSVLSPEYAWGEGGSAGGGASIVPNINFDDDEGEVDEDDDGDADGYGDGFDVAAEQPKVASKAKPSTVSAKSKTRLKRVRRRKDSEEDDDDDDDYIFDEEDEGEAEEEEEDEDD